MMERLNRNQSRESGKALASTRKAQVGSGERGDKIRTYRFQDNTVKDHRTEKTAQLEKVLQGNFDLLW